MNLQKNQRKKLFGVVRARQTEPQKRRESFDQRFIPQFQ